jgi:hypothetical protein
VNNMNNMNDSIDSNSNNSNEMNTTNLIIISKEVTDKECYNDYMITLSEPIKIKDLNINNIQLPKRNTENITELNNKITIEMNAKINTFELEPNYYNRYEIVEYLNAGFEQMEFNINAYLDSNDEIFFKSTLQTHTEKFKMISDENSLLPYLGFGKNTYFNKTEYYPDIPLDIGDNIYYLVLENISKEPIFKINLDTDEAEISKLIEFDGDMFIDHLIIKFYKTKKSIIKNDPKYSFFFESEHEIDFEFL